METNTNGRATWTFQTEDGDVRTGYATDARGLRLRAQCGYTHVKMEGTADSGWLQLSVAVRKLEVREGLAKLVAA